MANEAKQFGAQVKKLRLAKGWSQEKLADKVGLHRTYIGSIERGERNPSLVNIHKITKALGLSVSDFFKF